jgi:glycosyltransferase involved in cell wall biosynthesis
MNILFLTISWPSNNERNLYSDLMGEFIIHGHKVYVVNAVESTLNASSHFCVENDLHLLKVRAGKIKKTNYLRKTLSLLRLNFQMKKAINKHLKDINYDLIIANTPPITFSGLIIYLKQKYAAPFYLLLKDIWPQGSVDLKVFKKFSPPWFFFRFHEKRIYKHADYIGCMSPKGVDYILKQNPELSSKKVEECPNSIRPVYHSNTHNLETRKKFGIPQNSTLFIFSGNLGKGHGLDFLVDAIKNLADYDKAFFIIGGSGTHFKYLQNYFRKMKPVNAMLYERLPLNDYIEIASASDVGLILLDKRYSVPQFPSRLLSYLELAKPVLCAINPGTDIGEIVENAGCGRSVIHGDMDGFINAVKYLSTDIEARKKMGQNSIKLLEEKYTVKRGYEIIMKHFKN